MRLPAAEALSDFHASPWWPCPDCGGEEFLCTVRFERGQWIEDGESWQPFEPQTGNPTAVSVSDAKCSTCGTVTNLHDHYRWGKPDGD